MAQITVYLNYVIFFREEADYLFAVGVSGSPILDMCPADAAALFGISYPILPSGDMALIPKGMYRSQGSWNITPPGSDFGFPGVSGVIADPTTQPACIVPGQAGHPSSIFPAGPDALCIWSATIIRSAGAGVAADPPPITMNIAQRRWAVGFENGQLEGAIISSAGQSRDASRTIDGIGLAVRGQTMGGVTMTLAGLRPGGYTSGTSWERFYMRVRRLPTLNTNTFWRCTGNNSPSAGFALRLLSTGVVQGYSVSGASAYTDRGAVFTPAINEWYRIDIFVKYASGGGTDGRIKIYGNGIEIYGFIDGAGISMNANTQHIASTLGKEQATADNEIEIDFDDWINSDLPSNLDATILSWLDAVNRPIDWLVGSHVRRHWIDSASLTGWIPNSYDIMNQSWHPDRTFTAAELTSATPSAQLEGLTDALLQSEPDSIANVLGAASATIGVYARESGGAGGQSGYKIAGGAAVLINHSEGVGASSRAVAYQPSGMEFPTEISPFSILHKKLANANTDGTKALCVSVEYLGVWGPEDDSVFEYPISRLTNLHNCCYANTQWGYTGSDPALPVYAVGGTYVGNGLTQEFTLPGPCHFLFIRKTTAGAGVCWFAPVYGSNTQWTGASNPYLRVWSDYLGNFRFRVHGGEDMVNQNAITYQYIAFCDPGMRFNLTGAYSHSFATSVPKVNPLINSEFLANAGFVQYGGLNSFNGGTGTWYKGPGIAGNSAVDLVTSGILTSFMNFANGFLNTYASAHSPTDQMVYSLWRTADGGGECTNVMVQIGSYVGNGVNPRVIPLTPTSSRYPLFVIAMNAANGQGRFRDPSHVGINSAVLAGWTNDGGGGIEAVGLDSITVNGAVLNTNGVTYTYFAICGATTGMTNGTYYPTYCIPDGSAKLAPSPVSADVLLVSEGGIILNGSAGILALRDIGGIYTLVSGKLNDTLLDRQTGQTSVDVPILPIAKTGYLGG